MQSGNHGMQPQFSNCDSALLALNLRKKGTKMKTSKILSRVATFLIAALWSGKVSAAITIYITPGNGGGSVFDISGSFDGPISTTYPNSDLSAFSFAPSNVWRGGSIGTGEFLFSSIPAATINTSLGRTGYIGAYSYSTPNPLLWVGAGGNGLFPLYAGDVWTLTSDGPDPCSVPFADFVPGNYVYTSWLGSTTIYTDIIVPEPSTPALAGVGSILILLYRARGTKGLKPWPV